MLLPQLCCGNNTLRRAVPSSHGAIPAGPAPIVPPSFSFPGGFVRNDIKRSGSPLRAGEKRGANRVPADGQNTVFPRKNASIVGKLCYPWSRFISMWGERTKKECQIMEVENWLYTTKTRLKCAFKPAVYWCNCQTFGDGLKKRFHFVIVWAIILHAKHNL